MTYCGRTKTKARQIYIYIYIDPNTQFLIVSDDLSSALLSINKRTKSTPSGNKKKQCKYRGGTGGEGIYKKGIKKQKSNHKAIN